MDVQIDENNVAPATPAPEVVVVDEEDLSDEEDKEQVHLTGKRKKCTSNVWNYFTKNIEVVEVNGMQYEQLWGYCGFPKCKQR